MGSGQSEPSETDLSANYGRTQTQLYRYIKLTNSSTSSKLKLTTAVF